MKKQRHVIIGGGIITLLALGIAIVSLVSFGGNHAHGLSRKKIAELASYGITPKQYIRAEERANARRAALRREPPPEPKVVGPRFIHERYEPELLAWKDAYGARLHTKIVEVWSIDQVSEDRTIVLLRFLTAAGSLIIGPAEWAIKFALNRPPTPAEERAASRPHAVEELNAAARTLGRFPRPRAGRQLPVELFAAETLSPGLHEIIVSINSSLSYFSTMFMRQNVRDEALQRGQMLATHPPWRLRYLRLSHHVVFYKQAYTGSVAGPLRHSSIYELSNEFKPWPRADATWLAFRCIQSS